MLLKLYLTFCTNVFFSWLEESRSFIRFFKGSVTPQKLWITLVNYKDSTYFKVTPKQKSILLRIRFVLRQISV